VSTRTLMSLAEFENLPDDGNLHELDEGELVVMPPPRPRHGFVQSAIGEALRQASRMARAGMVFTETGFRLSPDVVQAPDVALIREERRKDIAWIGIASSARIWQSRYCLPTTMRDVYNGRLRDILRQAAQLCGWSIRKLRRSAFTIVQVPSGA
jgi:putative restriction endonuclease